MLNTESTYDWTGKQWSVPLHTTISKLTMFVEQQVNLVGAVRYWAVCPEGAPHGWDSRWMIVCLFPK